LQVSGMQFGSSFEEQIRGVRSVGKQRWSGDRRTTADLRTRQERWWQEGHLVIGITHRGQIRAEG